jgi:flavin reductase (DIM6/NTAB) family NADH-FMN oxidoreductase RutF
MHQTIDPAILYFGTPVILISTLNEDGSYNLAPISSVFWLSWRCVIGIGTASKTAENILRTKECVINLPSVHQAGVVNNLALTTGRHPVPEFKQQRGYRYERDKFQTAGVTAIGAGTVQAPRVLECPVNLEAKFASVHYIAEDNNELKRRMASIELKVTQVHVDETILMDGYHNRIDPDKWRPLIMSFQQFYGLGDRLSPSRLSTIHEDCYRTTDVIPVKREMHSARIINKKLKMDT